jgi:HPt (histidine-containing phosphotransfer) domain-containing protein
VSAHIEDAALRALLSQMGGDRQMQSRFVHDFVQLWGSRSQRLEAALAFPDSEEAHVVLLSIRTSSAMVGAVTVGAIAAMMHDALRDGDIPGTVRHLPRLNVLGEQACHDLVALFPLPPSPLR